MRKVKIGVIGTGHMGKNHVRILAEENNHFDFIGIYDKSIDTAQELATEYNTCFFRDIDNLLNEVEAVVVAVPSSQHCEVGIHTAKCGVNALIEKPIAPTVQEAQRIVEAFKENGVRLAIGHVERFNPAYLELKKMIDPKNVFYVEAHRYSPFSGGGRIKDVGVVEDLMIHDIDLISGLINDKPITDIRANGEIILSNKTDFATAMLDFGGEAHAIINASRVSQNKERSICVHMRDCVVPSDVG